MMAYKSTVPADPDYLTAIGQATYSFCYLEWQVIWVIQKLDPTFQVSSTYELTAGRIAAQFKSAVKASASKFDETVCERLKEGYRDFFEVVKLRSDLLHAHPFTSKEKRQRLGRYKDGKTFEWTPDEIDQACQRFDTLATELNNLFNKHLS